jgi:hypothetical protein
MYRYRRLAACGMLFAAGLAGPGGAQGSATTSAPSIPVPYIGGSAGISIPLGALATAHSAGFNLAGVFQYRLPTEAVGIRGEVQYERFDRKMGVTSASNVNSLALLLDALYHVPGYSLRPYVIGGMGLYRVYDATRPGLNGGVGIDIPLTGMSAYFEARLNKTLTDGPTPYLTLPISFGLTF